MENNRPIKTLIIFLDAVFLISKITFKFIVLPLLRGRTREEKIERNRRYEQYKNAGI